ncbi:Diguanylate cyclase (modular protein) [Bradyrhizobium sp. ORS 375]|uniref:sensor domain-containing diguanylate cyclase n=1 Tax=Bradyrhizobium sp. (strain ORS 375) TaxID=566679 RepID=UPI0002408BDF|nr:diguanylate cyclase [Bradyrhizobium sp. ORS 375]CCD96947.1 Diguanylate cyclase (modular protein) [Bradyrhizobium sp. ORS 375]
MAIARQQTIDRGPLAGTLCLQSDPSAMMECAVLRLTDHCAVVALERETRLSDACDLVVPEAALHRSCKTVWQSGNELILEFEPLAVDGARPATHHRSSCVGALLALRSVFDEIQSGILLLSKDTHVQFCNLTFRQMWNIPDELVEGRPAFGDVLKFCIDAGSFDLGDVDADAHVKARIRSIEAGDSRPIDLRRPDGQVIRVQCTSLPDGGHLLTYTRITDIVRHSDELDVLRTALDRIQDGVLLLDENLNALFINARMREYFGVTEQQAAEYPSYAKLLAGTPSAGLYGMSSEAFEVHCASRIAAVRAADPAVIDLKVGDDLNARVCCTEIGNGGRMLTYTDITDLARNAKQLEKLATVDAMTGVFNRRHFLVLAQAEWSRFQRYHRPLSVLMIDIDHFKSVNDQYGHAVGDEAIAALAGVCRRDRRRADVVGRLGGEEFAVLLPETEQAQALLIAERIRNQVGACVLARPGGRFNMTISLGIAMAAPDMSDVGDLLKAADRALYEAKAAGRNCSRVAVELPGHAVTAA